MLKTLYKYRKAVVLLCAVIFAGTDVIAAETAPYVSVYVTSWTDDVPDVSRVSCINYAFGHVSESFDSVCIDNEGRLMQLLELKKSHRNLKVVLSIGGWGSGGFSEMAADALKRRAFAWHCRRLIWDMGIDGIDIDWEYPTQDESGITASPDDIDNLTKLLKEIRIVIGPKRTVSVAVIAGAKYVNFSDVDKYVDYYNVMTYDMGEPPYHNSPLYPSGHVRDISASEAIAKFLSAGVPKSKIVMGIPFYGRGAENFQESVKNTDAHLLSNYFYNWDEESKVPYLTDKAGKFMYSYDDTASIRYKGQFIKEQGIKGAMCWPNSGDDEEGTLLEAVYNALAGSSR